MIGDRRAFFRQGLNDLYLPLYDRLCQILGPEWKPYSAFRSFDNQNKIFAIGRTQQADGTWVVTDPGKIETKAQGGESAHNYGCASDWTYFEGPDDSELTWLKPGDPLWNDYGAAVVQAKLRWGKEFQDIDHNELKIAISWKDVREQYLQGGMGAANAAIYAAILTE